MDKRPRPVPHAELERRIRELIELKGGGDNEDLVADLVEQALKLLHDVEDRGDVRVIQTAVRELRYAFKLFAPYAGRRKVTIFGSARTAADGVYRMSGIAPNYNTTDKYELRFARPGAGPTTALLGRAQSQFTNGLQRISDIVVLSGSNLVNLDLPIDPNGVVYNSMSRAPIPGAALTLVQANGGVALPSSCFYDTAQQNQVTLADGYYGDRVKMAHAFAELLNVEAKGLQADGIEVVGPTDHTIFKSIYFFDPNGHRLELAADVATPKMQKDLDEVKWAMLDEWARTKRAPKHAAWMHDAEFKH